MTRALFLFRRDLRLEDSTGLLAALEKYDEVIPAFILDPRQRGHGYFSENAFRFLLASLRELHDELRAKGSQLYLFEGKPEEVVQRLLDRVDAVHVNRDYTPFSKRRDAALAKLCRDAGVAFVSHEDALLSDPDKVRTGSGEHYKVFTPFYRAASAEPPPKPRKNAKTNYYRGALPGADITLLQRVAPPADDRQRLKGGRKEGLDLLRRATSLDRYDEERNTPSKDGTSMLSAHHKFGTVSIRETYHAVAGALGEHHTLISELYWRDFFTHLAYHEPRVFGEEYRTKFARIRWVRDAKKLQAWKEGKTGFPLVDAGMRELAATGGMHNRVRMVAASFLTKELGIDWRDGEKHFARHLTDYDPCVNNGNWQWSASVGADAKPLRIFNPWRQQERFDPDGAYVKRWVSELEGLSADEIRNLEKGGGYKSYPAPVIERRTAVQRAKERYDTR